MATSPHNYLLFQRLVHTWSKCRIDFSSCKLQRSGCCPKGSWLDYFWLNGGLLLFRTLPQITLAFGEWLEGERTSPVWFQIFSLPRIHSRTENTHLPKYSQLFWPIPKPESTFDADSVWYLCLSDCWLLSLIIRKSWQTWHQECLDVIEVD